MSYSLLFDIGNVIVEFDYQLAIRRIAGMSALEAPQIFEAVDDLKDPFESGQISSDQFLDEAIGRIGYTGERDFLVDAFENIFELNKPMVSLIERESAKGIPLFLLSNTNGIHIPFLLKNYPVFECFDDAIYSHEVFAMKPNPEIYEIAISKLQLDPAKTIYIDDMPENCVAGRSHGLHSIDYDRQEHADFLTQFERVKLAIEAI